MKTNLGKLKSAFLLTLLAAVIVCVSVAFAGIFSVKQSNSAFADTAEEIEEEYEVCGEYEECEEGDIEPCKPEPISAELLAEIESAGSPNAVSSDNDADGLETSDNATVTVAGRSYTYSYSYTLSGTCSQMASTWNTANGVSKHLGATVYVKLTSNWTAASVSGDDITSVSHGYEPYSGWDSYYSTPERTSFSGSYDAGGWHNSYYSSSDRYSVDAFYYGAIAVCESNIILDLNGYTIHRALSSRTVHGSVFYVSSGTLTIVDSSNGSGQIRGGYNMGWGGGILVSRASRAYLDSGKIVDNYASHGGGVAVLSGSKFYMRGGSIVNNHNVCGCRSSDGGVMVGDPYVGNSDAEFYMTDGSIIGNNYYFYKDTSIYIGNSIGARSFQSSPGSGVYHYGRFYLSGGTIDNGTVSGGSGTAKTLTLTWGSTRSFAYDGAEHAPTATSSVSGVIITVKGATNAGSHTAIASNTAGYTITNPECDFTITKRSVTINWRKVPGGTGYTSSADVSNFTYTYNGTTQAPIPYFSAYVNGSSVTTQLPITGGATSASSSNYTATATTTTYTNNYTFSGTTRTYKINAYQTSVNWSNTSLEYSGSAQSPTASYRTVTGTSNTSLTVTGSRTAVGDYTASVTAPSNYSFTNASVTCKITPKRISVNWGTDNSFPYDGTEKKPSASYSGLTITVKGAVDAGSNYTAYASCTDINYQITNSTKTFSITKRNANIEWVGESGSATDFTYTYSGAKQCPTAYFVDAAGNKISLAVSGEQINASSSAYTATASTSGFTNNYSFTGSTTKSYTINPMSVSVIWENVSFEYDGSVHNPSAYYENISGTKVALSLEPSLANNSAVGEYEAMVKAPADGNYQVTQASKTTKFTINAHSVAVTWTNTVLEYNGQAQKPTATYPVNGVATLLEVTGSGTNAGDYTASVTAPDNFVFTNTTIPFKITAKLISVTWSNTALEYTGAAQGPKATYVDVDGSTVNMPLVGGTASAITVGTYTVNASFVADPNYSVTNTSCTWTISPRKFTVSWGDVTSFVYNGAEQAPSASVADPSSEGGTLDITVKGAINAGSYTATVVINDAELTKNYYLTNPTKEFEITKKSADIVWSGVDGSATNFAYIYNGAAQCPAAYFIDAAGNKVNFTVSGGQTDASSETFTATASTAEYVGNYSFNGAGTRTFTVSPASVSVVWENTSFEYTGEEHNPTAYYVNVMGAKIELALEPAFMGKKAVGEYTAKVIAPTDTNYKIVEDSKTTKFYIVKATPKVNPVLGATDSLKVGMDLPTITTAEGDTLGSISWVSTELVLGTSDYVWVFVPANFASYNIITDSVSLEVGPADGVVLKGITATATVTGEIYANTKFDDLLNKMVIVVTGSYSNGTSGVVAASEYKITSFDTKTGDITVTMNDDATMTATFQVYVTPKAVTGITITYTPDGNKIYASTTKIDEINTVVVKAIYNDGTEKILPSTVYTLSGTLAVGENTILVTYEDAASEKTFKETFVVTAYSDEVALEKITASFVQNAAFTVATDVNDIDEFGVFKVEKVYNDGTKETLTEGYALAKPEEGFIPGTNVITVSFTDEEGNEFTTTFTVFVEEEVVLNDISASFAQNSTILTSDEFENLSSFGTLTVEGVYSDGTKKPITENYELSIEGGKFVEGLNEITVTYTVGDEEFKKEYTATFTVFAQATVKKVIVLVIDNKSSVVGEEFEELTYTVLSGNPEFKEGDIVLTKAEGSGVGTYEITGTYTDEDGEYEVKFVNGVYTITPNPNAKQITVVINSATSEYGKALIANADLGYTVIGLENGETLDGTVTLTKAEGTDAGEYAITGKYEGSNKYNVEFIDGIYTVTPKPVTVVIDNKATKEGETIADLTYSVIGLGEGEELDGTIKLKTNADANTPNEYAITGSFDGNNYAIVWVEGKYAVKTADIGTILVVIDNKTSEFGEALKELTFTIDDETVTKEQIESDLTLSTEATAGADAGVYEITATYTGGYTVEIISGTYTVTPKIVKVQIDSKLSFKGAELSPLTCNAESEFAQHITLSTEATGLVAGEFAITGTYDGSANYDVQFVNGVYTVKEIAAGITHVVVIIDNQTSVVGANLNTLTYTTAGLENGVTITGIEITTDAVKDEVGVYKITGKYTGTGNFVVVFVEGTYTVTAKALPEVRLSAKQTDEIFLNTTDFDGKLEFTLTVNGTESALTDYTVTPDLENGTVTVEFTVDGEKYEETVSVFVTAKAAVGIAVSYTQGSDKITPNTDIKDIQIKVTATYNDGTSAELEKSEYSVTGTLTEGISTLIVTHGDVFATFTVKVDPLVENEKTKTTIVWDEKSLEFVFDGKSHEPYAYYTINGGAQEVALKLIITGDGLTEGKAINAGTYTAQIDETAAIVAGYELQGETFHDFVIKEADIVINWTNSEASFDGDAHTPSYTVTATVNDGNVGMTFEIVPLAGSSLTKVGDDYKAVNAGKYVARVVITDGSNYKVQGDLEKEFTIGQVKISNKPLSTVDANKQFDTLGAAIAYVEGKYGDKVTVTGEQNADGEYVISVTLTDDVNYAWTEGEAPQSFKFGTSAVTPEPEEEGGVSSILIIALIAAMVLVALVALITFIILIKKRGSSSKGEDEGFYEAFNS